MDNKELRKLSKNALTVETASRNTDPGFYSSLRVLPNPDPILRAMGKADAAYSAIMADPHVIGELRSIRAGFLAYEVKVVSGEGADESAKQKEVLELCQKFMRKRPAPGMVMADVIWTMATAVFYGYRVHELVWEYADGKFLPSKILDRPNRRFKFDQENKLRLITKDAPVDGVETEDYKYLLTRHMPSVENPYGHAVLSSCFWSYTFKHGGWKFFYKFCERHGLPWPIGKFPQGTTIDQQNELLDSLLDMLSEGAAVIPNDDAVELLTVNATGELAQESMIHLCNKEMSKALTSQTLATEMHKVGSNAASKTHAERQDNVQESDRSIIESTFNELFRWITLFNFGPDVVPPELHLFKEEDINQQRLEAYRLAAEIGNPSLNAFHAEMNIPQAINEDDRLKKPDSNSPALGSEFNAPAPLNFNANHPPVQEAASQAADDIIESDYIDLAFQMLNEYDKQGKSLQEYLDDLPALFSNFDDTQLERLNNQVLQISLAEGITRA